MRKKSIKSKKSASSDWNKIESKISPPLILQFFLKTSPSKPMPSHRVSPKVKLQEGECTFEIFHQINKGICFPVIWISTLDNIVAIGQWSIQCWFILSISFIIFQGEKKPPQTFKVLLQKKRIPVLPNKWRNLF